jgi:short-subunit dehydrogenase
MSTPPGKAVLVTGANAGIGKDVAPQMASRPEAVHPFIT